MLALLLAYQGRVQRLTARGAATVPVASLATSTATAAFETALAPALTTPADRRLAARELAAFLAASRQAGEVLPNVGAILRAEIPASAIEGTPGVVEYAERLRKARESAAQRGTSPPTHVPMLAPSELALVKPGFTVRTEAEFRSLVFGWAAFFFAGFAGAGLIWRFTRGRGDELLLCAALLLTSLGFAALLSRADPLRDTPLFVRYVQGVLLGLAAAVGCSLVEFRRTSILRLSYLPLVGAFGLSLLLLVFGSGPGTSSAKVNLGPVQPIEAIRLLLALFLAGYFARMWELLRQVHAPSSPAGLRALMAPRAPARSRAARTRRRGSDAGPVLLAEGPGPGAAPDVRVPRALRGGAGRGGSSGIGWPDADGRLLRRLPSAHLRYARDARGHVAGAVGEHGARWRPGGPCRVGARHGRRVRHRFRSRRDALLTGGADRSGAGRDRRRAGPDRVAGRGRALRGDRVARLPRCHARRRRLRLLPRHGGDAVPDRAGAADGRRPARRRPAHGRGHAVPQLRRVGHGGQLRRARHPRLDCRPPRRP